ncbi:MAG: hypothetical protein H0W06_08135 [Chloroflexia bacterium]|nr:hypothetical protein [Chloroflexia bacterium]
MSWATNDLIFFAGPGPDTANLLRLGTEGQVETDEISITEGADEPASTVEPSRTPTATATAAATGEPASTAVPIPVTGAGRPDIAGNTYVSPSYGYSLHWDDAWQTAEVSSASGRDTLRLTNGASAVSFESYPFAGTPEECLTTTRDQYADDPAYRDFDLLTRSGGQPLGGVEGDRAFLGFTATHTPPGGGATDYAYYVECRYLEEPAAILRVIMITSPGAFAVDYAALERILRTLRV